MAVITVESIEVGMVLAADVVDRQGRMLLKEGTNLLQKHIQVLKTWGVTTVNVRGEQDEQGAMHVEDYPLQWQAEAQALADAHFITADLSVPLIAKLKQTWVNRYLANKWKAR